MASYYAMNKLNEMLERQKEELAKEMTVDEVLNTIRNRDTVSSTEFDTAITAGQLIANELNKYTGDIVNSILESGMEDLISTKATIRGLPANPLLDVNISKSLIDKLFGESDEEE